MNITEFASLGKLLLQVGEEFRIRKPCRPFVVSSVMPLAYTVSQQYYGRFLFGWLVDWLFFVFCCCCCCFLMCLNKQQGFVFSLALIEIYLFLLLLLGSRLNPDSLNRFSGPLMISKELNNEIISASLLKKHSPSLLRSNYCIS